MANVENYKTPNGSESYKKYLKKLWKKHLSNDVHAAQTLVADLKNNGFALTATKELKPLDANKNLYELKKRGIRVRIGVYKTHEQGKDKYVILDGFLKNSNKTPQKEIDELDKKIVDYKKRFE